MTCYPEVAKLPRQFKFADRMDMRVALVLGPDEAAQGKVTLKDLSSGTQETLGRAELKEAVGRLLQNRAASPS